MKPFFDRLVGHMLDDDLTSSEKHVCWVTGLVAALGVLPWVVVPRFRALDPDQPNGWLSFWATVLIGLLAAVIAWAVELAVIWTAFEIITSIWVRIRPRRRSSSHRGRRNTSGAAIGARR